MRAAQRNQRRLVNEPAVLACIEELLTLVDRQIGELEKAIAGHIAADPLWRKLDQAFRSIKGVAGRTVAHLMAEMPEIGTLPNKAISKLAGLAPLAADSGKHQGKRRIRGGRAPVREILFVVASVAGRYEPDFILFQQRLRAAENRAKWFASLWRTSCWCGSTPRPGKFASNSAAAKPPRSQPHRTSRSSWLESGKRIRVFRGASRRLFHQPS